MSDAKPGLQVIAEDIKPLHLLDFEMPNDFHYDLTMDNLVTWGEVVRDNTYRLPDEFSANDIIIDVGAHIGMFAYACLNRGAGKVICLEPQRDNFAKLVENLSHFGDRVTLLNVAAWSTECWLTTFQPAGFTTSTGYTVEQSGLRTMQETEGDLQPFRGISLRSLVELLPPKKPCRMLKLDCEWSEWEIARQTRFGWCQEVIGEIHTTREGETAEVWRDLMARDGFTTEFELNAPYPYLSLFWSKR